MFLGIEIGGTKLQAGVGPGDGVMLALERARVDAAAGGERIRQQILELVPRLLSTASLSQSDIQAVGIGFGGPVDSKTGTVAKSHQVAGWDGFPLADWCRRELGWPTVVHNDADTAGLAEACFGAGRGYSPIFYITIGSGIGGGLIIDQKIYRGAGAGAGEIGHLNVPGSIRELRFGTSVSVKTVESICSGWGMALQFRQHVQAIVSCESSEWVEPSTRATTPQWMSDAKKILDLANGELEAITVQLIARAVEVGNALAQSHLSGVVRVLAWAISQMITLICPRRIVIGGGVSQLGEDLLFGPLREEVARNVFPPFASCYDIVPAALGEAVVVHGALRLARDGTTKCPARIPGERPA